MIHVYSVMWNEEFMLPHFLKHYETVADRIFIIDDHSTDRTAEIAKAHPKVTYALKGTDGWDEAETSRAFATIPKQFPSDLAVCVDADEFIQGFEELEIFGDSADKYPVFKTKGYMMVGQTGQLEDCKKVRMKSFDKPVVFVPSAEIEFGNGRHSVNLPVRDSDLALLHYKYPSREHYLQRALDSYPRIMDAKDMGYRIKKGLKWYDQHI